MTYGLTRTYPQREEKKKIFVVLLTTVLIVVTQAVMIQEVKIKYLTMVTILRPGVL